MPLVKHDHVFWLSSAAAPRSGSSLASISSGDTQVLLHQLVASFRRRAGDKLRRNRDADDELLHSGAVHCLYRSRFLAVRCPVPRAPPTSDISIYHCTWLAVYRGPDQPTSESHLTTSPRTACNQPTQKTRITHDHIPNLRINFEVQLVTFRLKAIRLCTQFRVLARSTANAVD